MSWTKDEPRRYPCPRPIFWWFKETGSEWTCPTCEKVWVVRDNPSKLVGGRVFWPKHIPSSTYWTPYERMACDGPRDSESTPGRDPWDSDEGRAELSRMHASFPALAREVQRGRDRNNSHDEDEIDFDRAFEPTSLHAHEVTADDAAMIRMMAGASFGDGAKVVLPSGKTITGAEMRRWVEAQSD